MRNSLLFAAVLSTLTLTNFAYADEAAAPEAAAPAAAAEPAPPYTITYNVGLYSQYIFRGLTQTDTKPAIQGGVDFTHSSGLYIGTWASNISWLDDGGNYESSSLEWDIYGGYRMNFGESGVGLDIGLLNYVYPGSKTAFGKTNAGFTDPYTLEAYAALSYKWAQAKISYGITDIFGAENSDGSYYAELNGNIPVGETGITANLHVGYQHYSGDVLGSSNDDLYTYTDWKIGVTKSWSNGINLGAYYTDTDAKDAGYTFLGKNIGDDTFTVFVQKTF